MGPLAGVILGLAADLLEEAARRSAAEWDGAGGAVSQAALLGRRSRRLAQEDLEAHRAARIALDAAIGSDPAEDLGVRLADALLRSATVPLDIAETAADVATLGALTAANCSPNLRADATGAALIAAGAARAAAHLIEVNLSAETGDVRVEQARHLIKLADEASERALAAGL